MGPALSFTYVPIGAVAREHGVTDDKRPRNNVDGTTAVLKTDRGGCPAAPIGGQFTKCHL